MENIPDKLRELFEKPVWTTDDRKALLQYLEQNNSAELQQLMQEFFELEVGPDVKPRDQKAEFILQKIHKKIGRTDNSKQRIPFATWLRYAAAASVIFLVAAGIYNIFVNQPSGQDQASHLSISPGTDLPPGGNKAVLTLADGGQIILDTASNGIITLQAGAQVIKAADGQIEYQAEKQGTEKIEYNTVSTPVGGQYQLTLSDGTTVWLNAASSLRFPAVFAGKERRVFITGEAYFEVTHQYDPKALKKGKQVNIPFVVDVAGKGTVEVLGTRFNINSYTEEESVKTTLLEGSVSFRSASSENVENKLSPVVLSPGQQVILTPDGQVKVEDQVNLEKVVAWKNGYFYFSSSTLQEVMNQMARWYNLEVVFEGKITTEKFNGKIQRDLNLSGALKILESNNVHFRIEENKLYVKY